MYYILSSVNEFFGTTDKLKLFLLLFTPFMSSTKLRIKGEIKIPVYKNNITPFFELIKLLHIAAHYKKTDNKIEISLDYKNKFYVPIENMTKADLNLLQLLFNGTLFGAYFSDSKPKKNEHFEKMVYIYNENGKTIIETSAGIKFHIDKIDSWIFVETFILNIHEVDFSLKNKVVIDIGGNVGDSALYFASKGAKVVTVEPIDDNYTAMLENINLNKAIGKNIKTVKAAITEKDGKIAMYFSESGIYGGASFAKELQGSSQPDSALVEGYSLKTLFDKFNIKHVDLLKMDGKGCEFYLTKNELSIVDAAKIEYARFGDKKVTQILITLKESGFEYVLYLHSPLFGGNLANIGMIYAKKQK